MNSFIAPAVLALILIALGISNMRGNIASVHWYHRRRVQDKDMPAFCKFIGLGTVICGASLLLYSAASFAADALSLPLLVLIGSGVLICGLIAGLGMSLYAMIKYNKGIF